jgi:hypothetical protein
LNSQLSARRQSESCPLPQIGAHCVVDRLTFEPCRNIWWILGSWISIRRACSPPSHQRESLGYRSICHTNRHYYYNDITTTCKQLYYRTWSNRICNHIKQPLRPFQRCSQVLKPKSKAPPSSQRRSRAATAALWSSTRTDRPTTTKKPLKTILGNAGW